MTGPIKHPAPWHADGRERKRDHGARRREAEWRAYQALWQKPIDEMTCDAERFYNLRRNVLGLNRKQCARLLRVGVQSVVNWEYGLHPVPFPAYLALQLVSESVHYKLANFAWRDWEFIEKVSSDAFAKEHQKYVNELVNYRTGAHFTPEELNNFFFLQQQAVALQSEAAALHKKVGDLTRENTEIREMFRIDGVTAEVHAMRERIDKLLGKINTAQVLPLQASAIG